jgi:hypothetical protein
MTQAPFALIPLVQTLFLNSGFDKLNLTRPKNHNSIETAPYYNNSTALCFPDHCSVHFPVRLSFEKKAEPMLKIQPMEMLS